MTKNPRRNSDNFVKAKLTKRSTDVWNEAALEGAETEENRWENYIKEIGQRTEGVSAEKEKFIHGLHTASHKVLFPDHEHN